ncbi:MAG TPA: hypothetical protein VN672_09780 [Solirubrobacteraceae bacterium]|nr:hypothetical protein [Solirubrobacteraceae bacterium]
MAKLTRESRLRERRLAKQAKKVARKLGPVDDAEVAATAPDVTADEPAVPPGDVEQKQP